MGFQPGQSGNPAGRPKGASGLTKAARERIANECDPIGFLASVMNGEPQTYTGDDDKPQTHVPTMDQRLSAARTLSGKLVPDAKDRPITFDVGAIATPKDALDAMGRLVESMGTGDLTPTEARSVMDVVLIYLKAWEVEDLEKRIAALEAKA